MARVFTEGFELGDTLAIDNPNGGSVTTAQKRSGAYSFITNSTSVGKNITAAAEFYFRFGWRVGADAAAWTILQWRKGTTVLGSLRVNITAHKFELYTGTSTLVATGTTVWAPNTWYLLEVHVKIADAGTLELKVDGQAVEASFSGDTKPGADSTVDVLYFITNNVSQWFDDLALNDTTGGADNSWCGDGRVILLTPNAAGDETNWTPSTGANYACVDDIPPNTTDYVSSSTVDQRDLYNLTACGLTNPTILRVWAEARALDTVAAGGTISLPIKTGGTVYHDATPTVSLLTTYTKQLLGAVDKTNPGGGAWTTTQLDALQVGCQVKS